MDLSAHKWDIIPEELAITHGGVFHLKGIPIFYFPYFYKALTKSRARAVS